MSNEVLKDKNGNILNPKIPRYEKKIIKSTVLFENKQGQKGGFSINDNWENYKIIEVFYTRGEYQVDSSRAYTDLINNSGDLQIGLMNAFYGYGSGFWTSWKRIKFASKSKSVTVVDKGNGYVSTNGEQFKTNNEDQINILKVIGYK